MYCYVKFFKIFGSADPSFVNTDLSQRSMLVNTGPVLSPTAYVNGPDIEISIDLPAQISIRYRSSTWHSIPILPYTSHLMSDKNASEIAGKWQIIEFYRLWICICILFHVYIFIALRWIWSIKFVVFYTGEGLVTKMYTLGGCECKTEPIPGRHILVHCNQNMDISCSNITIKVPKCTKFEIYM